MMIKPTKITSFLKYFPEMIVFFVVASIPEIIATLLSPEGMRFTGALVNLDDLNTYLTAIRLGSEGHWLFTPPFSPEPIPAHLAYLPYLTIGQILGLFHLKTYYVGYLFLRVISLGFSFYAFDQLLKTIFSQNPDYQQKVFRVLLFAGGTGWILVGFVGTNSPFTPDLTTPEWNLLLNFFANPHFLLGIGFESLILRELMVLKDQTGWKPTFMIAFWGSGLGLTYPFLIPVVGLTIALKLCFDTIISRKIPIKQLIKLSIGTLPMIGLLLYYGIILPNDPWYQQTMLQNNAISPPHPVGLLLGFSFLLAPAFLGLSNWLKTKKPSTIPLWILANVITLYLPFSFAGRFLAGLFIPLSILAVYGIYHINSQKTVPETRFNRYFLLLIPGNILILLFLLQAPRNIPDFPYYLPESEIQALHWLGENTSPDDLVLAEYPVGSIAPRYMPAKVFIGHLNLTIDLADKRQQVLSFWQDGTSTEKRIALINTWGITYVYQGEYEKNISGKIIIPPGELVYQNGNVAIYAISPSQ